MQVKIFKANKALVLTSITLRFIPAAQLERSALLRSQEISMENGIYCKNCGTQIKYEPTNNSSEHKPCSKCGSSIRSYYMKAESGEYTLKGQEVNLTHISYPEKLLATAEDLIEKGEFSIAVVVAHMACEVSVERAISREFESKGIEYLQLPIDKLLSSYNIANDRVKNIYNALTSDKIQDQSFWQQFKESATRRNKAVHESMIATRGEGEASFDAARRLVEYLK